MVESVLNNLPDCVVFECLQKGARKYSLGCPWTSLGYGVWSKCIGGGTHRALGLKPTPQVFFLAWDFFVMIPTDLSLLWLTFSLWHLSYTIIQGCKQYKGQPAILGHITKMGVVNCHVTTVDFVLHVQGKMQRTLFDFCSSQKKVTEWVMQGVV